MSEEDHEMLLEESIKIEDELDPFEEVSNYNDISENLGETYDESEALAAPLDAAESQADEVILPAYGAPASTNYGVPDYQN